jgi:SNF2 family DNA or RNA helicase
MNRDDLHDYQNRMVEYIKRVPYCALFAEMGTGKSVSTLTAIADLIDDLEINKVLIVAPKKVAEITWSDEVEKWEHLKHLRVSRVMGTPDKRIKALNEKADIYVLGRDSFVWLCKHYKGKLPFDMVVLDELTSFKSHDSKRFKAFKAIRGTLTHIVGLTGTPAPNGYLDLWAQIYCIDGGERLGKFITHYRNEYFIVVTSPQGFVIKANLRKGAKEQIDAKLADMSMVIKAEDYLSMPPRLDIVRRICLPSDVKKQYEAFERDMVMSLPSEKEVTATNAATLMGKLMQFCNGAVYVDTPEGVKYYTEMHSEKIAALLEIREAVSSPVLVFYQYIHDKERIKDALAKNSETKHLKVRIYEQEQDLRAWNNGEIDVLLAHPASCSYGLNLQKGGSVIVWFGTGFNLEQYQQANARLYRQGQQMPVRIYHLVCEGTVDERAMRALQSKANEQESMMQAVKELMTKYNGSKKYKS